MILIMGAIKFINILIYLKIRYISKNNIYVKVKNMEAINEELENKQVERVKVEFVEDPVLDPDDPNKMLPSCSGEGELPKPKRVRSQKQKDAFEKARKKRAENIALKKTEKETLKKNKRTKITESIIDSIPSQLKEELSIEATRETPQKYKPVLNYDVQHHNPPQPIINNYYYGTNDYALPMGPPPLQPQMQREKKKKKKEIVYESSSSSEEEYEEHEIMQGGIQPTNPTLKYKFV